MRKGRRREGREEGERNLSLLNLFKSKIIIFVSFYKLLKTFFPNPNVLLKKRSKINIWWHNPDSMMISEKKNKQKNVVVS